MDVFTAGTIQMGSHYSGRIAISRVRTKDTGFNTRWMRIILLAINALLVAHSDTIWFIVTILLKILRILTTRGKKIIFIHMIAHTELRLMSHHSEILHSLIFCISL